VGIAVGDYQGPSRKFFQGLIQAAVGLHHFGNGNIRGARKLYHSTVGYLKPYAPAHMESMSTSSWPNSSTALPRSWPMTKSSRKLTLSRIGSRDPLGSGLPLMARPPQGQNHDQLEDLQFHPEQFSGKARLFPLPIW